MKNKKPLWITLIVLDVAITIFLLVLAIIMLAFTFTHTKEEILNSTGFIGYLQNNPLVYGLTCVVPLFVLLLANIIALVVYVKKTTKKEVVKVNDLNEEQKEALRQELLKELMQKKE